jgi:hypothetical protein
MSSLLLLLLLLLGVLGGGVGVYLLGRGRQQRQLPALTEASQRIAGRLSAGSADPELRAELDGRTVTLKLSDAGRQAAATTALPDLANTVRFYFGWDAPKVPAGLEHVKSVEPPNATLVAGQTTMRADDPALSARFLEATTVALTDLYQTASAKGLEVLSRGGYLTLTVHGANFSADALTATMATAAQLAAVLDRLVKSPNLLPAGSKVACAICTDFKKDGEAWVRCEKCQGAHHLDCWRRVGTCGACGNNAHRPFEAPA